MLRYKRQFGRELYPDLIKIYELFPLLEKFDVKDTDKMTTEEKAEIAGLFLRTETEWMYDIAFIMAQQADPAIRDELEWFDTFEDFNIFSVFIELLPMIRMEQAVSPKNE